MNKAEIVQTLTENLRGDFDRHSSSSKEARQAGNDDESRAEDQYDTRSTEENYLADGLARQAFAAVAAAEALGKMPLPDFPEGTPIDLGALVQLDFDGDKEWFFLAPSAGGNEVEHQGETITVVTPESPLGQQLTGRQPGEVLAKPAATITRVL